MTINDLNANTQSEKSKIRLILPGGGIRGVFQLGFTDSLLKSGKYEIDRIYGCSAGSIVAPFVAGNKTQDAIDLFNGIKSVNDITAPWSSISLFDKIVSPIKMFFGKGAYKSFTLVDKALKSLEQSGAIKAGCFNKCECVAWDFLNKKELWFTGSDYKAGMYGSSALWLAVPPVPYKDTFLIDGGVTEVVPVSKILEGEDQGFDGKYVIVAAGLLNSPPVKTVPGNALELIYALQWDSASQLRDREINMLKQLLGDRLTVVEPNDDTFTSALDIDPIKMNNYLAQGRDKFIFYDRVMGFSPTKDSNVIAQGFYNPNKLSPLE